MRTVMVFAAAVVMLAWAVLVGAPLKGAGRAAPGGVLAGERASDGPRLVVEDGDAAAKGAVSLEGVEIHSMLDGPLAQTVVTLTFRNKLSRALEGELEFPLPEGAGVVGYALDVPAGSGNLVDGACVEKEEARQIFENEERKRVDPGIAEQTRGNNYRVRVHPIPAGGTRTVQLTLVSDLAIRGDRAVYELPLDFSGAGGGAGGKGVTLASAKIKVEVLGAADAAGVRVEGLPGMAFTATGEGLAAEKAFSHIVLSGALAVSEPAQKAGSVVTRVEARTRPMDVDALLHPADVQREKEMYFMVSALPVLPADIQAPKPHRIGIIWDNSLSRLSTDKTAEKAFFQALAAKIGGFVNIDWLHPDDRGGQIMVLNRNANERGAKDVLAGIDSETYDGALRLDQFAATKNGKVPAYAPNECDFYILMSDGLVTLGEPKLAKAEVPVYTVSSTAKADHGVLKKIAEDSGGMYLDLTRMRAEDAAAAILSPRITASLAWNQDEVRAAEIFPARSVVPGQPVVFTGKLLDRELDAEIIYGGPGGKIASQPVTLTQAGATETGMVPRYWAQQKAAALAVDADRNGEALLALGKDFNIVTPKTSLLVLETVDQYLHYRVVPPKSRADVYAEFSKRIEAEGQQAQQEKQAKIDHILALWQQRVDWWKTDFAPTKDEIAKAIQHEKAPGGGMGGGPAMAAATAAPGQAAEGTTGGGLGGFRGATGGGGGAVGTTGVPATRAVDQLALGQERVGTVHRGVDQAPALASAMPAMAVSEPAATIRIKEWTPDAPYLKALAAAKPEKAYGVYLEQRKNYLNSPAFYFDCANFFFEHQQTEIGVRVLSNIAQLRLDSAALLRIAAYRYFQLHQYDLAIDLFRKVKVLRPDEPQSYRDLALAISQDALERVWSQSRPNVAEYNRQAEDLTEAMGLFNHVVMDQWPRFDEIEVVALMEANGLWARINGPEFEMMRKIHPMTNPLDPRLVKNLDTDVRIVMTWDADDTDIDLHVIEPTGEEAFYAHNRTVSGGLVSHDFTQGYGPEEYLIRHAPPGTYKIMANYYGSSQQSIQGPVTVQATVITNFGRPEEKRQSMTLRLSEVKETVPIGEITVGARK